jgi:integrase/recombinase XerD
MWLTLEQASLELGMKPVTLRLWCRQGKIQARQVVGYKNRPVWEVNVASAPPRPMPCKVSSAYLKQHDAWITDQTTGEGYERGYAPSSIRNHRDGMRTYWRYLEEPESLEALSVANLAVVLRNIPTRSYVMKEHCYKAFKHFMAWLIEHDIVLESAFPLEKLRKIRPKRKGKPHRPKLCTRETAQLLKACIVTDQDTTRTVRLKLAVQIMLHAGLRTVELINLRYEDIDLEDCIIHVYHGKGGKYRMVTFPPDLVPLLKEWRMYHHEVDKPLLNGLSYGCLHKSFDRLRKQLGLNVNLHGLRRTCATNWHAQGVDVHIIQNLLGHEDLKVTMAYVEYDDKRTLAYMHKFYKRMAS